MNKLWLQRIEEYIVFINTPYTQKEKGYYGDGCALEKFGYESLVKIYFSNGSSIRNMG